MTEESPHARLREYITGHDLSPEEATALLLQELPARWQSWVRSFVLQEARRIEAKASNAALLADLGRQSREEAAAGAPVPSAQGTWTRGTNDQDSAVTQATQRLGKLVYRAADGARVVWEDMTLREIRLKIAQFRKSLGSAIDHVTILVAAADMLQEHQATRIGDVPGWYAEMQARLAGADVVIDHAMTALPGAAQAEAISEEAPV